MARLSLFGLIVLILLNFSAARLSAQEKELPLVEKVQASIRKAKAYLIRKQKNGHWETATGRALNVAVGGRTALILVALMNAGVDPEDEIIQDGLKYLRTVRSRNTYVVGLQTMVFAMAKQKNDKARIQANLKWLEQTCQKTGWGYSGTGTTDHSINQYALLGIHEAMRRGYQFDRKKLENLHNYYNTIGQQGQYSYQRGNRAKIPTFNMTCAGLCNLIITARDAQLSQSTLDPKTGVATNCGAYASNAQMKGAMRYISAKFPVPLTRREMESRKLFLYPYYGLYGLERAGRLTGRRFFGGKDWYRIGCRALTSIQDEDGHWGGDGNDWGILPSTAFALLFLSKGRTPVVITKLAHGKENDLDAWNRKHDDMMHVSEHVSRELFEGDPLAWQVLDIRRVAKPNTDQLTSELLASPILYVSGHNLELYEKDKEIIEKYLENGGFIVAEACCGSPEFTKSFKALMKKILPDSSLLDVPDGHPIWSAAGKKHEVAGGRFPLQYLQKGCKMAVLFNPGTPVMSGFWNKNQHKRHLESVHSELSDLMDFYHHDYRLLQFDQLVTPKNEAEW